MEHVTNLVDSLAWPISLLVIAIIFKTELQELLGRVSSLKYGDAEAIFENKLAEIEINNKEILAGATQGGGTSSQAESRRQLERISDVSPRAAVLEAWINVERAIKTTSVAQGVSDAEDALLSANVRKLFESKEQTRGIFDTYKHLKELKNKAAHSVNFEPSQESIQRFIELSEQLVILIGLANLKIGE